MKKDELKTALGKINPSEELIQATLLKIEEQKKREKKRSFSFLGSFNYRYVGAFCAIALVLCVGAAVLNSNILNPAENNQPYIRNRSIENTDTDNNVGINIATFSLDNDKNEASAVLKGKLQEYFLSDVTAKEGTADGSITSGSLEIVVNSVEEDADYSALQGVEGTVIRAKIYFYSREEINTFMSLISEDIYFSLVPEETDGEAGWKVVAFSSKMPE